MRSTVTVSSAVLALMVVLVLAGSSALAIAGSRGPRPPSPSASSSSASSSAAPSPSVSTVVAAPTTTPPAPQLPGGGQTLFPGRRMVALYGHPGTPSLGVLGEQGLAQSVQRAKALAAQYQPLVREPVVPAFELITTVADSVPGPDGDYSAESTVASIRPWVDAASAAGMYVVLDLQPGRSDFLTQAKRYADLLAQPNVGLALDPEWRLGPTQVHRAQIGTVGITEVNSVVTWLAELTRAHHLPQKALLLHEFRTSMITGRERLDTSHPELGIVVHADGFGTPALKLATWTALHTAAPPNIHWGWKNFYDEDVPMFTPAQTFAVGPTSPVFVSYQ